MANVNGNKFGLTCLFPILAGGEYTAELRRVLRAMDRNEVYGSPLSKVNKVHMARFAIIDALAYQGLPAKHDSLISDYLLFMCDFDGSRVDTLVAAMVDEIGEKMDEIWTCCVAYPGRASKDRLTAYFEQCQLETNLFLADRPNDRVETILRALMYKRDFAKFVETYQADPTADPQAAFQAMWAGLKNQPDPKPGSL
jgi:hypothetical protein